MGFWLGKKAENVLISFLTSGFAVFICLLVLGTAKFKQLYWSCSLKEKLELKQLLFLRVYLSVLFRCINFSHHYGLFMYDFGFSVHSDPFQIAKLSVYHLNYITLFWFFTLMFVIIHHVLFRRWNPWRNLSLFLLTDLLLWLVFYKNNIYIF